MHVSVGLMLVMGIALTIGALAFADTITEVTGDEGASDNPGISGDTNTTDANQVELLVRFNPELWNTSALHAAANASHAHIGAVTLNDYSDLGLPGLELVLLPPGMSEEEGIEYYQNLPYVEYAEKNAVYSIESTADLSGQGDANETTELVSGNNTPAGPYRLLVQFNTTAFVDPDELTAYANQTHQEINSTLLKDFTPEGLSGLHLVELAVNMTFEAGISEYSNQTRVLFAEPDYEIRITSPVTV